MSVFTCCSRRRAADPSLTAPTQGHMNGVSGGRLANLGGIIALGASAVDSAYSTASRVSSAFSGVLATSTALTCSELSNSVIGQSFELLEPIDTRNEVPIEAEKPWPGLRDSDEKRIVEIIDNFSKVKQRSDEVRKNIFVFSAEWSPATGAKYITFNKDVKRSIDLIERNPVGKLLLEKIGHCRSEIYLFPGTLDVTRPLLGMELPPYSPLPIVINLAMRDLLVFAARGESIREPVHIILFHELTHAYHFASGAQASGRRSDPIVWTDDEEYQTIMGFPSETEGESVEITENAFRREEGLPERFGSSGADSDPSALTIARIKSLGAIHLRLQQASSLIMSSPPIAMCSRSDLGSNAHVVARVVLKGVNLDFLPEPNVISNWIYSSLVHEFDPFLREDECYSMESFGAQKEKEWALLLFPKLKGLEFEVERIDFLRLSEEERDLS